MINEHALDQAVVAANDIWDTTGFLPSVNDPRLKASAVSSWIPLEELDDAIPPYSSSSSPADRAVVAAAFYSVAAVADYTNDAAEVWDAFRNFLRVKDLGSISDPRMLRWELHAAAVAGDIERILAVARRFEDIAPTPEHFMLAATAAFLTIHPSVSKPLDPNHLDRDIRSPEWEYPEVSDLLNYLPTVTNRARRTLSWKDPAKWEPARKAALVTVDALLGRVNLSSPLSETAQAIRAWTTFALGAATGDVTKLTAAGEMYLALPPHPLGTDDRLRGLNLAAAVECFTKARKWGHALEAARLWSASAPSDPDAYARLAECLYKEERITEAIEAYEQYVKFRKEGENDWEASLLLRVGLKYGHSKQRAEAIQAAAASAGFREHAENMLTWAWPSFAKLVPKARERWWVGVYALAAPEVSRELGDARWDVAADAFGEAVSFQLRDGVFKPFLASAPAINPKDPVWEPIIGGWGTLKPNIHALLQARLPLNPPAKALRAWLDSHHRAVPTHLSKTTPRQLIELARLRGEAQHGSVDEKQTRQVYREAMSLLTALTE